MVRLRYILFLTIFLVAFAAASSFSGYVSAELGGQSTNEANNTLLTYIPLAANTPTLTNCRYGVNLPDRFVGKWMTILGVGYYVNFSVFPNTQPIPQSIEHLPIVRLRQNIKDGQYLPSYTVKPPLTMDEGGLGQTILANPGRLWIIGNEPDVANFVQDNMFPDMYAQAYHEVYHFIKELDPYAHVAVAGLSMMTPGRLQYLDIVWDTYLQKYGEPMPVDVWNMHLYILPEIRQRDGGNSDGKIALGTDPALARKDPNGPPEIECPKEDVNCRAEHDSLPIFKDQIIALRTWMKDHGQQNKPLLLSEFSLLYPFVDYDDPYNPTQCFLMDEFGQCFTQKRVSSYLRQTIDLMETTKDPYLGYPLDDNRLVQQWNWYSLWTDPNAAGGSSSLLIEDYENYLPDAPGALSQVGRTYRDRLLSSDLNLDLIAGQAPNVKAQAAQPGGTADVKLSVGFLNNGSTIIVDPFMVTFYADAAMTQLIGETHVLPGWTGLINGCSWGRITEWASITWTDLPVGTHQFWVKVDSRNDIHGETDEGNNVAIGQVTVLP